MDAQQRKLNPEPSSNAIQSRERKKWKRVGNNGLIILIKNINSADSDVLGHTEVEQPPSAAVEAVAASEKDDAATAAGMKICGLCGKGFGSAKALGGHMRVHVESQNNGGGVGGGTASSSHNTNNTLIAKSKKSKFSADPGMAGFDEIRSNNQVINGKLLTLICFVCGKGFRSDKSLYGHMRSHPDRNWRGIHPPLMMELAVAAPGSSDSNRSSPRSGDPIVGMEVEMEADPSPSSAVADPLTVGWSVKRKRGQKASDKLKEEKRRKLKDNAINVFVDCSVPMATNNLMLLAQAIPEKEMSMATLNRILRSIKDDQDTDGVGVDENTRQRRIRKAIYLKSTKMEWDSDDEYWLRDHFPDDLDDVIEEGMKNGVDLDHQLRAEGGLDVGSSPSSCSPSAVPRQVSSVEDDTRRSALNCTKKMKGKLKLTCTESRESNKQIDREVDPLAQRSRNKRKKPAHHLADDGSESPQVSASDHDEQEMNNSSQLVETPGPYKCRLCPKTFPTGQALGGHQRAHWNGAVASPGESSVSQSQSQSRGEGSGTVSDRRGLEIDLNEPAIAEEEELGLLALRVYDDMITG